jgi:bacterioferritin (cytochrome b1)
MNKKVIDLLNQARERELGAISQYMIIKIKKQIGPS